MKASGAAIFFREAFRNARRWQTYASRAGFAGVMLGMVLLVWYFQVESPSFDPGRMGKVGRTIFEFYSYIQFWLMCVLAPIVVSQGIVEEKEDRTLDMLAITRLSPGQIVRGKLFSRLLVLLVIIASGTPVMALIMSFGGVDPWEIVSVVVNTCVAVIVTGTMAAFLSLFARGAILPSAIAFLYTLPAFFVAPGAHFAVSIAHDDQGYLRFTPALATLSDWVGIWLPALSFLPVLIMTLRISGPLFEMVTSGGDDPEEGGFGYLSYHLWTFERFKKWGGLLSVVVMLTFPVALLLHRIPGVGALWATGFLTAGTWLYLLVAMRIVIFLDKTLAKVPSAGLTAIQLSQPAALEKKQAKKPIPVRRRLLGVVWGNPVAWRECATRAYGGITLFIIPAYLVYGAFLCLFVFVLLVDLRAAYVTCAILGAIVSGVAILAMVLNATASVVTERRAGTLGLLASTTMPSYRIVMGKTMGVLAYTGPLLFSAFALLMFGSAIELLERGFYSNQTVSWTVFSGNPLMKAWWTTVWIMVVYLTMMVFSFLTALKLRSPGFAYGVNLFLTLLILLFPAFVALLFGGSVWVDLPTSLAMPLLSDRYMGSPGATPIELLASIALYGTFGLTLFSIICWRLRPWIGATLR